MPFIAEAAFVIYVEASAFIATVGVIGQALIMAGIGVAASYLVTALSPKPNAANLPGGVEFDRQYGTNVGRQVACGLVGVAGHDIYVNTYGGSNFFIQQIYALSDFYATGLSRVAINGVWVTLGADDGAFIPGGADEYDQGLGSHGRGSQVIAIGTDKGAWSSTTAYNVNDSVTSGATSYLCTQANTNVAPPNAAYWSSTTLVPDYARFVHIKFYDGRQTVADPVLVAAANPPDRWTSANVGKGMAYVIVTMGYNQQSLPSFPDFFFEFKGAPLYDWRKDSTVGGSGSHRWGDVTTYEYSANPIVIEYNYRRGFTVNGDTFCGMDMVPADLPLDKFTTAANICDETQADGLPRYQCSILLDCMAPHSNNLQSLSLSCGSMQIDAIEGSWPLVGSVQSSVATFYDTDLISTADFKFTKYKSMSELVNSVAGNYPEPGQLWSMIGYNEQIASAYVTLDRRTRDINMDFPQVSNPRQAAQLARIYLYENRYEASASVVLRPRFQGLEAGDWVDWNSTRYGLRTYIVTGKTLVSLDGEGPRNAGLQLQERNSIIYNVIAPPAIVVPSPPGLPVYATEVSSFNVLAISVVGTDGRAQPGIRASWAPFTNDGTITGVELLYYPTAQGSTAGISRMIDVTNGTVVANLADGIVSNTPYTVQARIVTNPLRTTVFNAGLAVTTLNITTVIADLDTSIAYQVTTLLNNQNDRIASLEQQIAAVSSNANGREWNNKQMVQSQLMSITGSLTASITTVMTVATSNTTALASLTTSVGVSIGALNASVATNATAIATTDGLLVASWSMTLDVNGYISGLKQISDGTTSTFVINSSVFKIVNPAAFSGVPQTVFTLQTVSGVTSMALRGDFIADGTVFARAIAAGSITSASGVIGALSVTSLSIGNNAVTVPVFQTLSSTITGTAATPVLATPVNTISVSVNTAGLTGQSISLLILWQALMQYTASPSWCLELNIQFNGGGYNNIYNQQATSIAPAALVINSSYVFTATGGTDVVDIQVKWNGNTAASSTLGFRTLSALAAKR